MKLPIVLFVGTVGILILNAVLIRTKRKRVFLKRLETIESVSSMKLGVPRPDEWELADARYARAYKPLEEKVHLLMSVIISLAVLGAALYVILSNKFHDGSEKWAYATIGTIIGFWLKPS